jgi:hypothetical protein
MSTSNPFQPPITTDQPRRNSLLWGVAIGVIACLCLCSGACLIPAGFGIYVALTQRGEIAQVIDACLKDIEAKRTDAALAHFSTRATTHNLVLRNQLAQLSDNAAFQNYQQLTISSINISKAFNTDPKKPQGTVATVSGGVTYDNGGKGAFRAILEKEDKQWRLYSLHVNRNNPPATHKKVPPTTPSP